ncbi:hypothetical protein MTR_3g031970 [Medicago truncatula]|uniref:Uncharacterized protein n=1 Tax=Medicago truncatula TaxID=3880 RepID=G7IWY4_MEDTR|nr:hypothetical protein MTR_3g031970 [Medicago truncatula]
MGMGMGSGWVHITPLPVPYPCFETRENPNPYPNPVKVEKTRQIGVGMVGYPRIRVLLSCLALAKHCSLGNRTRYSPDTSLKGAHCQWMEQYLFNVNSAYAPRVELEKHLKVSF